MEMQKLKNGIYATAMDMYVNMLYEEIEDDDIAESMYEYWLGNGVPDGNTLEDNINDFGSKEDINELLDTFLKMCKYYKLSPDYSKEIEEIKKVLLKCLTTLVLM